MASGVDRDNDGYVEAQRLTVTQSNVIQCFCSYKVHNFLLLIRCYLKMDFDV
jgi:hypothetical protein